MARLRSLALAPILASLYIFGQWLLKIFQIGYESDFFAPFRFESLLYIQNAIRGPGIKFFLLREWSTSPDPSEHPLLYLRNFNYVHMLAGGIQYALGPLGTWILLISALGISIFICFYLYFAVERAFGRWPAIVALLSLVIVPQGLRAASNNFLLAVVSLSFIFLVAWLTKLWRNAGFENQSLTALSFAVFLSLSADINTGFVVITLALTALAAYIVSQPSLPSFRNLLKAGIFIFGPALLIGIVHTLALIQYDLFGDFIKDLQFARLARISGSLTNAEALKQYKEWGMNFFGIAPDLSRSELILSSIDYLHDRFSTGIMAQLALVAAWLYLRRKRRLSDFFGFSISLFLSMTLTAILLVFISGDTYLKIALSKNAFFDCLLPQRLAYLGMLGSLAFHLTYKVRQTRMRTIAMILLFLVPVLVMKKPMSQVRRENLEFKKILASVPADSDIITNFEPAPVAVVSKSRVWMSWFNSRDNYCELLKSPNLIPMFRVTGNSLSTPRPLYLFYVFYSPYSESDLPPSERLNAVHCVNDLSTSVVAQGQHSILLRVQSP